MDNTGRPIEISCGVTASPHTKGTIIISMIAGKNNPRMTKRIELPEARKLKRILNQAILDAEGQLREYAKK